MTPEELEVEARASLAGGLGHLLLVVQRSSPPSGENVRLARKWGPLSNWIACVHDRGDHFDVVAYWDAAKVLRWIQTQTTKAPVGDEGEKET